MIKKQKHLSRITYYIAAFLFVISGFTTTSVSAVGFDETFYERNDILFYDPTATECSAASGTLGSPAPTQLTGANNPEKVWNYFTARGLTPIGAASAMGNMEQESSAFDPWAGESGNRTISKEVLMVGFGIIQWTNTGGNSQGRRYGVMKHLEDNGVALNASDLSQADQALLLELNWLWDGEYGKMTWQEQVNAETTVDGNASVRFQDDNTGNGGAMVFHKLVERSGDDTAEKQQRIDSAKKYLDQFGTSSSGSSCAGVAEGGLTEEQAKKLMMNYGDNRNNDSITAMNSGVGRPGTGCNGGALSNCVSFSAFFLNKFTNLRYQGGNGNDVVSKLASAGAQTGSEPRPFAVFSNGFGTAAGHTGIILGVQGDQLIVGHASCSSSGNGRGDGTKAGGGAGWIEVGTISRTLLYSDPPTFAYPSEVDTQALEAYVNS